MAGFHSIPIRRFREFPGHDLRTLQVNSYDGTSEHVYRPRHEKHNVIGEYVRRVYITFV